MSNLRDELLEDRELRTATAEVTTPKGVKKVTVREMTLDDRLEFEAKVEQKVGSWSACLVVACVVDEGGNQLFSWEDAATMGDRNADRFADVLSKARDLNFIGPAAEASAEKNSSATPTDASNG
ncbi:MAG: hypothetical protein FWD61_11990 [Phycisphaerales bacterium]|nr:hypothetical protein [Phycisphaerales bacterium]